MSKLPDNLIINQRATDLAQKMADGLGFTVSWTFRGTKLTPDELRSRLTIAGLDPDTVDDIEPLDGIKAAVREFTTKDGKKVVGRAAITKKDAYRVIIGIRHLEHRSGDDEAMDAIQQETLVYDLMNNTWEDPGTSDEAGKLRERVLDRQTYYDGNAVREKLVMPMVRQASGVQWAKGVYFTPTENAEVIGNLQDALRGTDTFFLEVGGIVRGVGQEGKVYRSATETLGGQLEAITTQIDGWVDMTRRVRTDTVDHVMGRFDELMGTAQMYEAALSVSLGDLQDRITELRERAHDVVNAKDAELGGRDSGGSVSRTEALAAMETAQLAGTYLAITGEEAPADRDDLIAKLDAALQALEEGDEEDAAA